MCLEEEPDTWKGFYFKKKNTTQRRSEMSEGERANRKGAWRPLCGRELKVGPCTQALNPETQSQQLIILVKKKSELKN